MEFVAPFVEPVTKCLWDPFARRFYNVKNLQENFSKLKKEINDLSIRREDINREINRDTTSKKPLTECQAWLDEVKQIEKQQNLVQQELNSNQRCFDLCCFPDIPSRMKLGKHVVSMLDEVTQLKEKSIFKGGVVVDVLPVVATQPLSSIVANQEVTDCLLREILGRLRDGNTQVIGLWGLGGVGKTFLMKNLNNLPEVQRTFGIVIWVTVSKDGSVRMVQKEIANRLQLTIEDHESDDAVAAKICQNLITKKYLLLLDDVWRSLNLEMVGIPMQNKEIGGKTVVTTRDLNVLKSMGTSTDAHINVQTLSEAEAWSLFRHKAGQVVDSKDIEPIAREIVNKCGGLPLVILAIGGSLMEVEDVHEWRNALQELKRASFDIGDMQEVVFERLKVSYDRLKNDNIKNCFLYCALYPEDYEIPVAELVEHWRAAGFIDGVQSLEQSYDKGHTIVNNLTDHSLLERKGMCIKMHDLIKDLALRITSSNGKGPRFSVMAGEQEECPNQDEWENAERISLVNNRKLKSLHESPKCNKLSTLLLQGWEGSIPESFFHNMPNLRVLNLSNTRIRNLPSISNLTNLRGLYVIREMFVDGVVVPSEIGRLRKLEMLLATVVSIPLEVRQLTNLRSLRVEFRRDSPLQAMRTMSGDGFISSLCLLEDLRVYLGNKKLLSQWCEMVVDVRLAEEVGRLKHLTSLAFEFSSAECLDHFFRQRCTMNYPQLRHFHLSVSKGWDVDELSYKCSLGKKVGYGMLGKELRWCPAGETISSSIQQALSQANKFELFQDSIIERLSDLGTENISQLRECRVEYCSRMETIVDRNVSSSNNEGVFPYLQELDLFWLMNLRSICDPPHSFTALKRLGIWMCTKLRYVCTWSMIRRMSQLERLDVGYCKEMEEIVVREDIEEDDDQEVVFFPRLKYLYLEYLPTLGRIWKGGQQAWPSLETVRIGFCENLKTLNMNVMTSSALREIEGEPWWWEALEWDHDDDEDHVHLSNRLQLLFRISNNFSFVSF